MYRGAASPATAAALGRRCDLVTDGAGAAPSGLVGRPFSGDLLRWTVIDTWELATGTGGKPVEDRAVDNVCPDSSGETRNTSRGAACAGASQPQSPLRGDGGGFVAGHPGLRKQAIIARGWRSTMMIALPVVVGVDFVVVASVAFAEFALTRKRWMTRQSGAFRGVIWVGGGGIGGLRPKWGRGYGHCHRRCERERSQSATQRFSEGINDKSRPCSELKHVRRVSWELLIEDNEDDE